MRLSSSDTPWVGVGLARALHLFCYSGRAYRKLYLTDAAEPTCTNVPADLGRCAAGRHDKRDLAALAAPGELERHRHPGGHVLLYRAWHHDWLPSHADTSQLRGPPGGALLLSYAWLDGRRR